MGVFVSNPGFDISLQSTSGQLALWQASGATPVISAAALLGADPGSSWLQVGSGSFFSGVASDASDILLQNTNGSVAVWQMQGGTLLSSDVVANPGPNWQVEGTGDFNGDGKTDIALQNTNGNVAVWEMSGGQISQSGVVANPGPNWHIEATGDFNGDGKSDMVLQNTNGNVAIWNMNGDQISQSVIVANPGTSWHVEGTGDFSGDGHTDLLLQNNNGSVAIWEMNGDQISQDSRSPTPAPLACRRHWRFQQRRHDRHRAAEQQRRGHRLGHERLYNQPIRRSCQPRPHMERRRGPHWLVDSPRCTISEIKKHVFMGGNGVTPL